MEQGLAAITNQIVGAALDVHRALGPGYQESVYANAMEIAMHVRGLRFEREKEFEIQFRGQVVGKGRVDFLVESKVVFELKAVEEMIPLHTSQVISYLSALQSPLALLINFNVKRSVNGVRRIAGIRKRY